MLGRAATLLIAGLLLAVFAPNAFGLADQTGWPPMDGLMMNKTDSSRPLDARPGRDPFGGRDPNYRCDSIHGTSASCAGRFEKAGKGFVMTSAPGHHRLLGGHGNDTIRAGRWGDVIWGDYKPSGQPTSQFDRIWGGNGPDFIYPSHGRNVIKAGRGRDIIHGRFGRGRVDCGPGRDFIYIDGRYRKRWKMKSCEIVSTRTGKSAPRWLIKKLPWTCGKNQVYTLGQCHVKGQEPKLPAELTDAELEAPYDVESAAATWALRGCQQGVEGTVAGARAAATAVLTASTVSGLGTLPRATADRRGFCSLSAQPSGATVTFSFARFLRDYAAAACTADDTFQTTAASIIDDVAKDWRPFLRTLRDDAFGGRRSKLNDILVAVASGDDLIDACGQGVVLNA